MRKQPTVHSPLGAFGNFTFPNWTQRVHIRDALSVPMATVRTEWGEACDSFLAPSAANKPPQSDTRPSAGRCSTRVVRRQTNVHSSKKEK